MDPWVHVEVCQSLDPFLGSHVKYGPNILGGRPEFGKLLYQNWKHIGVG